MRIREVMTTIKVSIEDFARTNKSVITVLSALHRVGGEASTRKLPAEIKMIGYGEVLIRRAEKMGFIKREKRKAPSGKGFHPVYNILTLGKSISLAIRNNTLCLGFWVDIASL